MKSWVFIFGVALVLAGSHAGAAPMKNFMLAPNQPQQDNTIVNKAAKARHPPIVQSDSSLLGRTDSTPVNVVVKLDYEAIASYDGNIAGLAATNPQKTGRKLSQNKAAVDAYTGYVTGVEAQVLDRIRARIPTAKVRQYFRTVYGGVAMTLPANRIDELVKIEGVVAVQPDHVEHPVDAAVR